MRIRDVALLPIAVAVAALAGCTSFGPVRTAEVTPGPSVGGRLSFAAPPGDDAAWFWAFDCVEACDHAIAGYEVDYSYGFVPEGGGRPYELGIGVAGALYPYIHGYLQLREGDRPLGVGARIGVPVLSWHEHQVYVRSDLPLGRGRRLLLDPALFLHAGRSPNGENPGAFVALVPAVGLELPVRGATVLPSAALVAGWLHRESYGRTISSFTAFPTASLGILLHRRRPTRAAPVPPPAGRRRRLPRRVSRATSSPGSPCGRGAPRRRPR